MPYQETTLDEIRYATNKDWVLGNDYFREKLEAQIARAVSPSFRGGDRRSKEFRGG